ncbi:hypothetical protein NEIFLAOT_00229 [Neisseria flavescens NRL30031/H210]|uniref:Uncharacterized protein n=1 Tax=Neisseria flavescens NRL30031/H210 TaxID=546264 RepID=C0EJZ0_NEIFL|nr:hypothetical protein NEIFLAOT_00229 [Neisseria flavescens NRL30031/H210]
MSGNRFFALGDVFRRVGNQYVAAVFARAGAHIDDEIGFADGVFVVFDHNHAVAQIAQAFEGGEQAVVVALVQADGGFVQNVHHAGQAAADLAGEADALGFAAGEGFGGAGEIQVIQPDINQKAETFGNFFEDFFGDLFFVAVQIQRFKELVGFGQRPGGNFVQGFAADVNVAGFFAQTCAAAARAGAVVLVFAQFFAHGFAVGFAVAAFEIGDDAFEGVAAVEGGAAFGQVSEINDFLARAVQHDFFDFCR